GADRGGSGGVRARGGPRRGCHQGGTVHARDDDRDQRAPRAGRGDDCARHDRRLRARPPSPPSGARASLPALRAAPGAAGAARASTTAADAYLGPIVAGYARSLARRCAGEGLPEPLVMRSSGGVASIEEVAAHPAIALVSGPAAGVVGAARICALAGVEDAVSFDMGGTSTERCPGV